MYRRFVAACISVAALTVAGGIMETPGFADPSGEPAYADGGTYWMHSPHVVLGASQGLLTAPPIYVLGFPVAAGTTTSVTLPSGYQPQCDPCLQEPVAYHDHLLTGEPGAGTSGTAGDYRSPWRIVIMRYTPAYANSPAFQPVTSDDQLAAAEAAGDFLRINPNGPDPYEIWTDKVLICPLVRTG